MTTSSLPPPPGAGEVLVVDDFRDTLALYDTLLSEEGHHVRTARTGVEALRLVDQREPDLVLLDVSMPGMDGFEVLKTLRARRGGGPAVIMLTAARREPDAIEEGLRKGADAYLTKPIEARELLARVRAALESHRLRQLLESQRRDHIAMLVHDLRHPLSSLGLVAEVLESEEMSPDERRDAVATIRSLCADMSRLVDGVLVASRLEAGVFSVEPRTVSMAEIIQPTLSTFGPLATRRRIALSFDGSGEQLLNVDPPKLRQAVDNLLANAVKFTPKGGKVRVRVQRDRVEGRPFVVIEVADSGPGIEEAAKGTIFERYRQGAEGRAAGGAGLGLAIARGIAEAHGGSLVVQGSDLGGAAFRLSVPLAL